MDIKILEKIGEGLSGSVYKAKLGNEINIYKIQKLNSFDKGMSLEYNRVIDFNDKVCKKHPDYFMVLKA